MSRNVDTNLTSTEGAWCNCSSSLSFKHFAITQKQKYAAQFPGFHCFPILGLLTKSDAISISQNASVKFLKYSIEFGYIFYIGIFPLLFLNYLYHLTYLKSMPVLFTSSFLV